MSTSGPDPTSSSLSAPCSCNWTWSGIDWDLEASCPPPGPGKKGYKPAKPAPWISGPKTVTTPCEPDTGGGEGVGFTVVDEDDGDGSEINQLVSQINDAVRQIKEAAMKGDEEAIARLHHVLEVLG